MRVTIHTGDCRAVLARLLAASVDAIVTDPPYGFGFMGREWDTFSPERVRRREEQRERKGTERRSARWPTKHGTIQGGGVSVQYDETPTGNLRFQRWCAEWARECLRVLKPGGYLLACGGPRTFHRLTAGIEDAGFEIRDCLSWLYGSGFPKSHNLPGGLGTALKPAWEPIILARKPLIGTVAANVAEHGAGALNIDGCRIEHTSEADRAESEGKNQHTLYANPGSNRDAYSGDFPPRTDYDGSLGRWPANVCLDEAAAAALDEAVGDRPTGKGSGKSFYGGDGTYEGWKRPASANYAPRPDSGYGDTGGPSRFFYTAKASREERNRGLEGMPERNVHPPEPNGRAWDIPGTHSQPRANHHPTVKPVDLMRWLVRLVTPPAGIVLDPFMGSGTTGIACVYEERNFIGIEREAEYIEIARRRIERAQGPMFAAIETIP